MNRRLRITGIVQGVGFRPYVWHLARALSLTGWVRNDAAGVEVLVQGEPDRVEAFTRRLPQEIPPLARVDEVRWQDQPLDEAITGFSIIESGAGEAATMIGVDTAVCPDCLAEMFDPADRRYRYAFINCTHCGPRYTLTRRLPYDRAQTSMAAFPLCPDCEREYRDPANRRFHAEPTACPVCGPKLSFSPPPPGEGPGERENTFAKHDGRSLSPALPQGGREPVASALDHLRAGRIVAIKGLGGFHLACDARNTDAVAALRARKNREEKPFALMAANAASLAEFVEMDADEIALLESRERPIVLLRKKPGVDLPGVAPGLAWLGAMLPYTPIHWLLFHEAAGRPDGVAWMAEKQDLLLVMTSANPGGEPLVIGNEEAETRLAGIADAFLMHDREIVVRCDDSVVRLASGRADKRSASAAPTDMPARPPALHFRRARGYTPAAIRLPRAGPPVLALGGMLKNTICVTRGDEAFLSQHIGGLDNPATCEMLMEVVEHLLGILQVRPAAIAHDLHPDFFSTRHAQALAVSWGAPLIPVQHHHAHIAAVATENAVEGPLLGLALDGVGLGIDGGIWGGELLRLEGAAFRRLGHLATLLLPGGDRAAKEPWRMAAAVLQRLGRSDEIARRFAAQPAARQLHQVIAQSPVTSSLGRVFDAAAGLLGIRAVMAYEGQAAMLLEGLAESCGEVAALPDGYVLHPDGRLDLLPLLARLADEPNAAFGAAQFHATLAEALTAWTAANAGELRQVALGGGCFLNHLLSRDLRLGLEQLGFEVLEARQAPPNDGGLSLGQAWVAMQSLA